MRCPNCGNENPVDYVFCDECGARLQNLPGEDAEAVSAPLGASGVASTPEDSAADGGPGQWQTSGGLAGSGDSAGSMGMSDAGQAATSGTLESAGAIGGGMGASSSSPEYDMPAGSASQGEPQMEHGGSEYTEAAGTAAAQDDAVTFDAWQPIGGQSSIEQTPAGMQEEAASAGEGDDESAAMPVTEDTVESASMDEGVSSAAMGDNMAGEDEITLPGVIPMMGSYSDSEEVSTSAGSIQDAGASAGGDTAGGGEWASAALDYLDQAQQAAGQGDWSGFGEALSNLRTYLQTASQGVQSGPTSASTGTGPQSRGIGSRETPGSVSGASMEGGIPEMSYGGRASEADSDASTATSGTPAMTGVSSGQVPGSMMPSAAPGEESGAMMDGSGGGSGGSEVATLEPAAEAGTLGAEISADAPDEDVMMARLVMIATGAELPIPDQEEIMVGREDPSSGIFPDIDLTPYGGEDGGVSRRHARLLKTGEDFFVEDLQSTNYTKLDGQRLPAHVRERLEDGARLDFGRVATIFRRS